MLYALELPSQRKSRDSNPQAAGVRGDGLASRCITVLRWFIVENRGYDPRSLPCKGSALPNELIPLGDPDGA